MEELGKVAETAKGDVDYVVSAAGATFDPDWEGALVVSSWVEGVGENKDKNGETGGEGA